jgi:hypothetical protein
MGHPILMLIDYRGAFWSSTRNARTLCSMNVEKLRDALTELGHEVEVVELAELDLSRPDLRGKHVIYTSSEDDDARYKRYVEAKVVGLTLAGARPIPGVHLLFAHHDKVMMESVRQACLNGAAGQPDSRTFGTLEEFRRSAGDWPSRPAVLKPAHGAGSAGVTLVSDPGSGDRAAKRLMRSAGPNEAARELAKRRVRPGYVARSLYRRGVVLQEFKPGLRGDYKVLRFGERFYALGRTNRPNDFRASGSGRLDYAPGEKVDLFPLLDAAMSWSDALGSPFCSLDIAYDPDQGIDPFLIEFQCVNFGPATAENSTSFYVMRADGWTRVEESCNLERVFAEATSQYIETNPDAESRA